MLVESHIINDGVRSTSYFKGDIVYSPGGDYPSGAICGWQGNLGAIPLPFGEFEQMLKLAKLTLIEV